jgi:hypothetical protein
MSKHLIAVNLFLALSSGLLGWQLNTGVKRFNSENDLAKFQPVMDVKQRMGRDGALPALEAAHVYNPADFAAIPDQNLFSDTRAREEKTDAAPAVAQAPELLQKPVLVGVTLSGNQRLAMILDPASSGGRKSITKRVGDIYQGYTITDITDSQIVLESGGRREIFQLYDGSKHNAQAGKTPIIATRVVNFGGTAGTPTTVIQGGAMAASPAAARPASGSSAGTTPSVTTVMGARETQGPMGSSSGVVRPTQQVQPVQTQPARQLPPGASWNESTDSQGRRVIRTPFGDIPRPNTNPPQ